MHRTFIGELMGGYDLMRYKQTLPNLAKQKFEKTNLRPDIVDGGLRLGGRFVFLLSGFMVSAMLDWTQCTVVERGPGKSRCMWRFKGTHVPATLLFENLEVGATVNDFLEWYPGVTREQVLAVLEFAERSLIEV
jgi:uncharacterized protein (DUF433 family)